MKVSTIARSQTANRRVIVLTRVPNAIEGRLFLEEAAPRCVLALTREGERQGLPWETLLEYWRRLERITLASQVHCSDGLVCLRGQEPSAPCAVDRVHVLDPDAGDVLMVRDAGLSVERKYAWKRLLSVTVQRERDEIVHEFNRYQIQEQPVCIRSRGWLLDLDQGEPIGWLWYHRGQVQFVPERGTIVGTLMEMGGFTRQVNILAGGVMRQYMIGRCNTELELECRYGRLPIPPGSCLKLFSSGGTDPFAHPGVGAGLVFSYLSVR